MGTRGIITAGALVLGGLAPVVAPDAKAVQPAPIRPGPAVLYADAPPAPQLENRNPRFKADPILVMGEEAYVGGEYLYQDWIYDDNGSDSAANDAGGSDTGGDVEYPAEPERYAGNAADLVELRIAPSAREVAYRFTLNTLLVEDSSIVALGFDTDGDDDTAVPVARDSGLSFPGADEVIQVWGTGGEHVSANGTTPLDVTTDLEANQLTVVVPREVSDPSGSWEAGVAAGLFDPATGGWIRPEPGPLDPEPAGVYDLGLTFDEAPAGLTPHDAKQSVTIRGKDAPMRAIDFDALTAREDRTSVPTSGTMSRLFPSRISFGEGKDYDARPELLGQLQPYSIYVPSTYDPSTSTPLMLDLHSLGEHHWQYNGSKGVQQIGEQRGAIVITCECRGEDGWYLDEAEYDTFEMWNDVNRHFNIDMDRVGITGYSMGGYATYRLATLYPDLFGKALSIVGPPIASIWIPPAQRDDPTLTNSWLENARNVPFLNAVGVVDELVPYYSTRTQNLGAPEHGIDGFDQLGYRFRFMSYPTADHFAIAVASYDLPYQREWLGDARVEDNPTHVTFSYVPGTDNAELGLVHDKAYWVSGIRLADETVGDPIPKGTVDAVTHAHGRGDPTSVAGQGAGQGPFPYLEVNRSWGEPPVAPAANKLTLDLTNVGEVTIDLARAGLSLNRLALDVTSTHTVTIHLVDGARVEHRVVQVG